jgi:hypothetical protein
MESTPPCLPDDGAVGSSGKRAKPKCVSSKYDFVKVRVWLSAKYHYVLSRFLISRTLTAVKVRPEDAIAVSLRLKKRLVDT